MRTEEHWFLTRNRVPRDRKMMSACEAAVSREQVLNFLKQIFRLTNVFETGRCGTCHGSALDEPRRAAGTKLRVFSRQENHLDDLSQKWFFLLEGEDASDATADGETKKARTWFLGWSEAKWRHNIAARRIGAVSFGIF